MSLQTEIDTARGDIKTDSYPMSIGEWISLYEKKELDVHPEFQRFYRWEDEQKSRFIESILLGIPIPPIFVAQRKDGVWDVIDGLQRLSTIFEFVGILLGSDGKILPALRLGRTKYLPSLEGKLWDSPGDSANSLDTAQRMLVKRSKIGASIILQESDPRTKFELFQRLNTGGSMLSDQEVRNCLLVMVNPEFYRWLSELSKFPAFRDSVALTDRALKEQYDVELVLRFLVLRKLPPDEFRNIGDVGEFLTDQMVKMATASSFDRTEPQKAFESVFSFIHAGMNADAYRRWVNGDGRFKGGFLVSAYEAVAIGLGHQSVIHMDQNEFARRVKSIWNSDEFVENSGSGIRASTRIPKTVLLGRSTFAS